MPNLPGLRQELRIEPGAPLVDGAPSWTLFDPVRHSFFQLGRIEFQIFRHWASGSLAGLKRALAAEGLDAGEMDSVLTRTVDFALKTHLTVAPMGDAVATFASEREGARKAWWRWLMDNYLFIRIPLVRPAAWLERTLPHVAPIWSRTALTVFIFMALAGLLLVSRQWDEFLASFSYFFSWEGVAAYGLALVAVKIAHELGHAWQATRFGARVPSMGISFLVMMPMLYTDTTGAWRIRSRRQRLMIDCAGVGAELMIASVATLAWVVLPDGVLRSVAFVLATTSWIMSLAINLNPFMRFDGYYVLSDLIGVPNLQPRAFALGRWRLRELLFDLGEPPPEALPAKLRRFMVVYAWVTWAYRLVLFIGIALLVYHLFFKLLGIVLFIVEMVAFVFRPILSELAAWRERREAIMANGRGRLWMLILGGIAVLLLLPLDSRVSAPAVLAPIGAAPVVAGDPARIERVLVANGARVAAGAPLMLLAAPELEREIAAAQVRIARIEAQVGRSVADARDLSNRAVLERELATERDALAGLERRRERLVLRAPIAGVVVDIEPDIHPGRWLRGSEPVARVVTPGQYDIRALVPEEEIWRLEDEARARFVPDDPAQRSRRAKVVERASSAARVLDQPLLASVNGGDIAVDVDESKQLRPRSALYSVRLVAERDAGTRMVQPVPGRVLIDATRQSLAGRWLGGIARVLRAEASLS